jgi:hypothetical protein
MTEDLEKVGSADCKFITIQKKDNSLKTYIIKNLNLSGHNSLPCPLIVEYSVEKKESTIKIKDLLLPEIYLTCNLYFHQETADARKKRIQNFIHEKIFDMLREIENNFDIDFNLYMYYVADLLGFEKSNRYDVIEFIHREFMDTYPFLNDYFSESLVTVLASFWNTYYLEFKRIITPHLETEHYINMITNNLNHDKYKAAEDLWEMGGLYVPFLNYYILKNHQEEPSDKIALSCCSINAKDLQNFMKSFYKSILVDRSDKRDLLCLYEPESEDIMNTLIEKFESLPTPFLLYYIQEKLHSKGVPTYKSQGNIKWVINIFSHNADGCNLDYLDRKVMVAQAVEHDVLKDKFITDFNYCNAKSYDGGFIYSVLFEIDFMPNKHDKYCEIVFYRNDSKDIFKMLPRTDPEYSYYLPCDNEHNPNIKPRIYI